MTEYVFLDGEYIEADKATIPVRTHAFLYGTGVFEGIRAYYNKEEKQLYAFRMKEHYERLLYQKITVVLLRKNAFNQNAYIRPTLY